MSASPTKFPPPGPEGCDGGVGSAELREVRGASRSVPGPAPRRFSVWKRTPHPATPAHFSDGHLAGEGLRFGQGENASRAGATSRQAPGKRGQPTGRAGAGAGLAREGRAPRRSLACPRGGGKTRPDSPARRQPRAGPPDVGGGDGDGGQPPPTASQPEPRPGSPRRPAAARRSRPSPLPAAPGAARIPGGSAAPAQPTSPEGVQPAPLLLLPALPVPLRFQNSAASEEARSTPRSSPPPLRCHWRRSTAFIESVFPMIQLWTSGKGGVYEVGRNEVNTTQTEVLTVEIMKSTTLTFRVKWPLFTSTSHVTSKFLFWPAGEGNSGERQPSPVDNGMIQCKKTFPLSPTLRLVSLFYTLNSNTWSEPWIQFYVLPNGYWFIKIFIFPHSFEMPSLACAKLAYVLWSISGFPVLFHYFFYAAVPHIIEAL
ncbi:translation initiation factor IF-2-like [Leopardus geoffroyi]|uniref:translation initiation factor IF-2-like n=1 Tax=Leopardus geoffroyi TaxID=46844 RepID=UPI001E25E307|nr:translation initiation factor IF-2-like [Leopardus geoffroyi]